MHTQVFPNGSHVCEVEVDPDTGEYEIVQYVAIDDVGRAINPLIVDGQTHGGIVQGVGQAMCELVCVDKASGQPLTGSLMDYAMPRADQFPFFKTELNEVPSPTNPLGIKAGGEGGTTRLSLHSSMRWSMRFIPSASATSPCRQRLTKSGKRSRKRNIICPANFVTLPERLRPQPCPTI